jgi:hypothetical protein
MYMNIYMLTYFVHVHVYVYVHELLLLHILETSKGSELIITIFWGQEKSSQKFLPLKGTSNKKINQEAVRVLV